MLAYRLKCIILSHPAPFRILFALLRWFRPVAKILPGVFVVAKSSDVREVLDRFDDFTLHDVLDRGIPWGPFMITIDWRAQHARERGMMLSVVSLPADLQKIRELARETCRQTMSHAAEHNANGRSLIDVVSDLAEPVMVRVATEYFGIPPVAGDAVRMAHVMRQLASTIMVPPPEGTTLWTDSRECIHALTETLTATIAQRRSEYGAVPAGKTLPAGQDDLLSRLVAKLPAGHPIGEWFDEAWILRYLTGLAGTGGATIARGTTQGVDRLLAHPRAVERARALVRRMDEITCLHGHAPTNPDAAQKLEGLRRRLQQIIYEAMRFRPMLPLLFRSCPREAIIANGSARARLIPAGSTVIAAPMAAMFDPEVFEAPARFCSTRPLEDYVHFGFGPRECFGRYVADVVMVEIFSALLRAPRLERAGWWGGRVVYDGPAVGALHLSFYPDQDEPIRAFGSP